MINKYYPGPLGDGTDCINSTNIGQFNLRIIQQSMKDGGNFSIILSVNQNGKECQIECLEYDRSETEQVTNDYEKMRLVLVATG